MSESKKWVGRRMDGCMAGVMRVRDEAGVDGRECTSDLGSLGVCPTLLPCVEHDGPLLSRRGGSSTCGLAQALYPLAQWEQIPISAPYIQIPNPWWGASQEVCSAGMYTWTLKAGRKGSVQDKIFPRTSGDLGWEVRVGGEEFQEGSTPWCAEPMEASLLP